jgi:rhamnose transport system permease protein
LCDQHVPRSEVGNRVERHHDVLLLEELLADEALGLPVVRGDEEGLCVDSLAQGLALRIEYAVHPTAGQRADRLGIEVVFDVTRNVDLSIGSVLGISAYAVGVLYTHHPHVPLVVVFLLALGIGATCGVVNGLIVTVARVPSLVVTLGTLYIIRGIDGAWAGGNQVNASMLPESFNKIGYGTVLGVPYLGIIAIVAVAIATYAMRTFRTARDFYAIGSDPAAARLAGIPVGSRVFLAFVLSGGIAGVAGAIWLSYFGSVDAIAGVGYEFQVIAAVVVGGVAIFGGSGTVLGAALGALLLNTINSALVVVNVSSFWSQAVAGALLVAAIAFDRLVALRVAPALRTRRRARG